MQHHRRILANRRPTGGSFPGSPGVSGHRVLVCGLLLALAAVTPLQAQVFPENPTLMFSDGFENYSKSQLAEWTTAYPWWQWEQSFDTYSGADWYVYSPTPSKVSNGVWGSKHLVNLIALRARSGILLVRDSIPPATEYTDDATPQDQNPDPGSYNPADWKNFRFQVDMMIDQLLVPGIIWAATSTVDTAYPSADRRPADGYVFWLDNANSNGHVSTYNCINNPTLYQAQWHLSRLQGWDRLGVISGQQDWIPLASGDIIPKEPGTDTPATLGNEYVECLATGLVYRFRLDYYCGNLRVQYMIVDGDTGTHPADTEYIGCASAAEPDGICTDATKDECWCEIFQAPLAGIDPAPIEDPGMVGLYQSSNWTMGSADFDYKKDNVEVSTFGDSCGLVCGDWSGWSHARTDAIQFKYLYEGALVDFSAGRNITSPRDQGKIDANTEGPVDISEFNHSLGYSTWAGWTGNKNPYCNGWNLLAPLPSPAETAGNIDDIQAFLEPMSTAVAYEPDGSGGFDWVAKFDNDPLMPDGVTVNPDYDPLPMVTDGTTPINSGLLEAFDWYVEQRTTGDWATDPYEGCRQWYVILITDGDEGCEYESCVEGDPGCFQNDFDMAWYKPDSDRVCDPGQAASKFADPQVEGVDPLPVYTIGFSESVSDDSPLQCIADQTGGLFLTAENASELSTALYDVFYRLEGEARSFTPFKIAPPPSGVGGNETRDYLVIYPFFQPQDKQTLWSGNLWAFPLNKAQPTLPTVGDCQVDTSKMVWNAYDALSDQLDDYTEANPTRFVFMGSNTTTPGSWVRHDMGTMPSNPTLRTEFINLLDRPGGVTDPVSQQIVNFVRNIYQDNDGDPSTPGPPASPRPSGYPVLGDTFHSQPVIVNPPNNSMYFFNYGYNVNTERGAHDYRTFIEQQSKRRRIVLAGANDGMLHAFDGGFWDRVRPGIEETYDGIHDLGNGTELFAWVPRAVMDQLYLLTAGGSLNNTEPRDMVDGPIVKGDAFFDFNGDGDREWRTVALASMRRGGRGVLALDITQPDPISASPDYEPLVSTFPGCMDGSDSRCSGEYPRLMWEFSDIDEDLNGENDLGWTWSKPAIARIAISQGTDPPDDVFIAFFGGGWDADNSDQTGTYFYGVNLETGVAVVKHQIGFDLPGGVTALDSDSDGFHDRIYFADSNGSLWRIKYPSPTAVEATGPEAGFAAAGLPGVFTRIFDFRGFPDRQEIFTRPVPVPALFDGSHYTWALAFGSGDRAELDREDSGFDHFYFVLDVGDDTTRYPGDLLEIDYSELNNSFDCTTKGGSALDPAGGTYGWYLSLRETEKVVFDATVLNGYVFFPTFDPSTETAVHGVPSQCGSGSGGGTPVELSVVCRASGIGRTYQLWYECGLGDYKEYNDIVTGMEVNNVDGSPEVEVTGSGGGEGGPPPPLAGLDPGFTREHSVTNWRQE